MSAPKRLIRLLALAAFICCISLLHQLNKDSLSLDRPRPGRHEEVFLDTSVWSTSSRNEPRPKVGGSLDAAEYRSAFYFRPGTPKPSYTRVMVVPRLKSDNVSWIADELPDMDVAVYVANDPMTPLHPPKNKGHEVMIYLTYIIDHYDALPDVLIFMHAHRWTHHNNELLAYDAVEMVRRLSSDHVIRQGYVNMRCHWSPGCPDWLHPDSARETLEKQEQPLLSLCWSELFPSDPLPVALGQACCAQFAVGKERILSIPLSRFIFYRDWISRTSLSDYISGRIWEYSWQFLFTGQSILCPAEHVCYCDGFGLCFGGAAEYNEFIELRRTKQDLEIEINGSLEQRALFQKENSKDQRSNASGVNAFDSIRYASLVDKVDALEQQLSTRREHALRRGDSPKNRAEECGRR